MARPAIIEKGYDPVNRTWADDSPVGRLLIALRAGNFIKTACGFAGVSTSSWAAWRARAQEHHLDGYEEPNWSTIPETEHVYAAFLRATDRVITGSEVEIVARWYGVARSGDWRAAMNFLARRWPDRWGNRVRVDVRRTPPDIRAGNFAGLLNDPRVSEGVAAIEEALTAMELAGQSHDTETHDPVSGVVGGPHAREGKNDRSEAHQ